MTIKSFDSPVAINEVGLLDYKLLYYHPTIAIPTGPNNEFRERDIVDLTPLVQSLKWQDNLNNAPMEADIVLSYHESLTAFVGVGGLVTCFANVMNPDGPTKWDELWRMFIWRTGVRTTEQNTASMTLKCYDGMIYTVKNDYTATYYDKTASEIIEQLCRDFNVPFQDDNGNSLIEDTNYKIPRLMFRQSTIWDIMITALTESRWATGDRYIIRFDRGRLRVMKKKITNKVFSFVHGQNIYSAELNKSLEEAKSVIKLYAPIAEADVAGQATNDAIGIVAENDQLAEVGELTDGFMSKYYGTLTHMETGVTPMRFPDADAYLEHLRVKLAKVGWEGKMSGPDVNSLRWGDAINVYEPLSGLAGQFYIMSASHTITPKSATMELDVYYESLLPDKYFEEYDNAGIQNILQQVLLDNNIKSGTGYRLPLSGTPPVTQRYGANPNLVVNGVQVYGPNGHNGIDYGVNVGTPVYAAQNGIVTHAGDYSTDNVAHDHYAGIFVKIKHEDGLVSMYAHLNPGSLLVKEGQQVARGDHIGDSGASGFVTAPHLHFQMMKGDYYPYNTVDPDNYVAHIPDQDQTPDTPPSGKDLAAAIPAVIFSTALDAGGDPYLALAVADVETGGSFNRFAKGDSQTWDQNPYSHTLIPQAYAGYCSFGLYQMQACTGAGVDYLNNNKATAKFEDFFNVVTMTQQFVIREKRARAKGLTKIEEIAWDAQRAANQAGYMAKVHAAYTRWKYRGRPS